MTIRKQLSWGRSSVAFSLIVLLTPTNIKLMEQPHAPSLKEETVDTYQQETSPYELSQSALMERPRALTEEEKRTYNFYGYTFKQLMTAYEDAPLAIKHIVDHLNYPDKYQDDDRRSSFFVGEPGSGKTVTALSIPHVAQWFCAFFNSNEIEGVHRNEASDKLITMLRGIARITKEQHKKVVVIIDELEELLEHFESEHYDTASTARTLWQFLDSQRGNRNFFLIGVMNRNSEIPKPLKSRMYYNTIYFKPITDPTHLRHILCNELQSTNMRLHEECNETFIKECIAKMGDITPRDCEGLRQQVSFLVSSANTTDNVRVILRKHIEDAIALNNASKQQMNFNRPEETDSQRQERHHKENLAHQRKLHDESISQQKLHHRQGIQTNLEIQANQKTPAQIGASLGIISGSIGRAPGITKEAKNRIVRTVFTPQQANEVAPIQNANNSVHSRVLEMVRRYEQLSHQ